MSVFANPVITLGSATVTANQSTASATAVQATNLTVTVTIPAGGRLIRVSAYVGAFTENTGATIITVTLWDGTVGSGTQIGQSNVQMATGTANNNGLISTILTPASGSKTYNVGIQTTGGTATLTASATNPAYLLVEAL